MAWWNIEIELVKFWRQGYSSIAQQPSASRNFSRGVLMITQSVRRALFDFAIACALVILFVVLAGITKADPMQDAVASAAVTSDKPAHDLKLWDFIRVGANFAEEPKWDARPGKADVQIHGTKIVIHAYYEPNAAQSLRKIRSQT